MLHVALLVLILMVVNIMKLLLLLFLFPLPLVALTSPDTKPDREQEDEYTTNQDGIAHDEELVSFGKFEAPFSIVSISLSLFFPGIVKRGKTYSPPDTTSRTQINLPTHRWTLPNSTAISGGS